YSGAKSRRLCGPVSWRRLEQRIGWPATSSDAGAATGTHVALKAARLAAEPGRGPCASLTGNGAASRIGFVLAGSGNSSVVEHRLAKARVAGSNPVSRSNFSPSCPYRRSGIINPRGPWQSAMTVLKERTHTTAKGGVAVG